jgi:hypothetical protein
VFLKILIFLLKINIFYVFRFFLCADLKNNFKKIKKYHFNVFINKKHFEAQLQFQIDQ